MFNKINIILTILIVICSKTSSAQNYIQNNNFFSDSSKITQYLGEADFKLNHINYEEMYKANYISEEKKYGYTINDLSEVWTELHPKVPRVNYWGVHFVNNDTGVAVGERGAVIRTTDGGGKWLNVNTPFNKTFRGIGGHSEGRIIAAGDSGIIILSEDYGESWRLVESGTNVRFFNLQMINDKLGWIVGEGATALKTTDGGLTWLPQVTPLVGYPFYDVSFLDSLFGYITAWGGQILRTTDGGISWIVRQAGNPYTLTTIKAVTKQKAVALGFAGKHVYTSDGGESWQQLSGLGSTFRKIAFIDTLRGFAAGEGSFETTNGGLSWNLRLDIKWSRYITFPSIEVGYIAGDGLILEKTTNSGQSWFRTIINDNFTDVFFTNEQNGWFIGGNRLYQTTDGGATLITRSDFPGDRPSSVYFLDSLTGIVGVNNKIFKTYDGGFSWEEKNIIGIDSLLFAGEFIRLFFITNNIGWALSDGYVIKTTDGGENWQSQSNAFGLRGIHFSDSLNGWVTPGSKPFKTVNGGGTWIQQTNFPSNSPYDVFFNDSLNGFISLTNKLYNTTDGGISWALLQNVTNFSFGRFSNLSYNNLFLAGGLRTYESKDAGENWNEVIELRNESVEFMRLTNVSEGFAVGRIGLIIRLSDSVVNVEGNNISPPNEYRLYQNYPNPFNNSTSISFNLQENVKVKLIIYDSLGRQVKILVDKEFQPGFHTVNFTADDLASGIYIYKLEGGGFIDVKKMILLK